MIRSSLVSLALAGVSFVPNSSLLAQGSKGAMPAPSAAETTKQGPQDADKRALEAELLALKKQSAELEALARKLKEQSAQNQEAAAKADANRKAAVAQERDAMRMRQDAEQKAQDARIATEQAERKRAAAERIARIEKRVAAEIARVKENAKKEIDKARAEALAPTGKRGDGLSDNREEEVFVEVEAEAQGQPKPPVARKGAIAAPMLAERLDARADGARHEGQDSDEEPVVVMLDDVSEAHRTHEAAPEQEPAARSPKEVRIREVEGKRATQTWRATKVEPNEGPMRVFAAGEDGLPHHVVEVREHRIETDDDADGSCCDCDCPMCGNERMAPRHGQGREPQPMREVRSRVAPRAEGGRGRIAPRRDETRRVVEMRIDGNEEDMEIERLLSELRRRLQSRRGGDRAPGMFEVRGMPIDGTFEIETEGMPAPRKPATEVRRVRVQQAPTDQEPVEVRSYRMVLPATPAPAPQTEEAPIEVRGVPIAPQPPAEDAPPVEVRRARTKKASKVAPPPMPPSPSHDGDAWHEIPPSSGGR